MSVWLFLLVLLGGIALALWAFATVLRRRQPVAPTPALNTVATPVDPETARYDAKDTVPPDMTLNDLVATRTAPGRLPPDLPRRAERLRDRAAGGTDPGPMRALGLLLVDTIDAGLPDAFAFHDGARIFLSTASAEVLTEFATELELRLDALGPWLDHGFSSAAINVARAREPGCLDRLADLIANRQSEVKAAGLGDLLQSVATAAARGQPAGLDSLRLANFVAHHPEYATHVMTEMASHPGDPIWTAARLNMEERLLTEGHLSNVHAFRSRVMEGLRSDHAALRDAAVDAAHTLLDTSAVGDLNVLWATVGAAVGQSAEVSPPMAGLADRLGIARPQTEGDPNG